MLRTVKETERNIWSVLSERFKVDGHPTPATAAAVPCIEGAGIVQSKPDQSF